MDPQKNREISILAGMDPSGGAGLLRDLWVCEELAPKARVRALCTGLTRQPVGQAAAAVTQPGPGFVRGLAGLADGVWKVGMLGPEAVAMLQAHLRARAILPKIVLDPVQRASAGGQIGALPEELAKLWAFCSWVTPNSEEARALGASPGRKGRPWKLPRSMQDCAAWWIKSVSADHEQIWDELHVDGAVYRLVQAKSSGPDPRGTGCALSTALAVFWARDLGEAPCEALYGWSGDQWKRLSGLSAVLEARLGPVFAASRWLAKARRNPVLQGHNYFLPRYRSALE